MWKDLKEKAIKISWKDYILVKDRILYFNEKYPNGSIRTEIIQDDELWIIKAYIFPDVSDLNRIFTWYSQALEWSTNINKTSAIENAETSAVGRALAMMWIWVIESIASADEIYKAKNTEKILDKKPEDHECKKCWAVNNWVYLKTGKYWDYFKCESCWWFSKPNFKGYTWEEPQQDLSEMPF